MSLEFHVLGPLEVVRDGVALDLGGAKQRAVLAALLVERERVVGTERLADLVWEGAPPAAVATTLRAYISNLRKALRPDDVLLKRSHGYVLDVPSEALDSDQFERLASEGKRALLADDHERARSLLSLADAMWRGRAYEDFAYSSFAGSEASRLEDVRLNAVEDLIDCRLARGEHAEVTGELEALTTEHSLRERLWAARMLALYRSGRQGDALKAYEDACRRLADELGIEPSPELRDLHASIVRQDEDLLASTATARPAKQTLSFVFTDVELSTEMLLESPDELAYARTLEEHRTAVREAFATHGGQGVRTWGDSFFAAFDCATDAVRAALEAQLALHSSSKETRVRMGVHSGEVAFVDDDYVGLAVHAAARVGAAAHGGQVLISQAARELLDAEIAPSVSFLDLGPHRLKDIPEPIRLYQLLHPELPKSFPAVRTLSSLPHNLPAQATSFVGRERDVLGVADALERARVVTLTGIGGVGKTRLSIEVGAEVLPRYPEGVWLCELAPIGDLDGVVHAIAGEMGVLQVDIPLRDSLIAYLRQRHALVLLDNCEHVLGPVAELVEAIVRACPSVDVLATSREGIGVEGEHILPVRSLTVPSHTAMDGSDCTEAMQLFTDRAQAVRPEFEVGPHNFGAVAEICQRLDGIPLAIELAAARVASMGPLEIAARLDQRFRFLRSGRRTAVERHRTLQAAIDWSYGLMSKEEQLVFERLSVFAGGFTLDCAESVCGPIEDFPSVLDALVAKSIIDADTTRVETRYSMLETLRQYAQVKLEERGEAEQLLRAHAEYFTALAERAVEGLKGAEELKWVAVCEDEFDNFRAAHRFAIGTEDVESALRLVSAVGWYAAFRMISEVEEGWTAQALALPGADRHRLYPYVIGLAAYAAWPRGALGKAKEFGERALSIASGPTDCRRLAALNALAASAMLEGRLDDAMALGEEIVTLARSCGERFSELQWRVNAGLITGYRGDVALGLRLIDETKKDVEDAGGLSLLGHWHYARGQVLGDSDPEMAIASQERALELFRSTRFLFAIGISLNGMTSVGGRHGNPVEALHSYRELIEHWTRARMWSQQWNSLLNLVELFARMGLDEPAVVLMSAADASPTAPWPYGAHGERLAKLKRTLKRRLGAQSYDEAWQRGADLSDDDAVAYALSEIRAALERVAEQPAAVS